MFRTVLHATRMQDAQMSSDRARALDTDPDLAEAEAWQPMEHRS